MVAIMADPSRNPSDYSEIRSSGKRKRITHACKACSAKKTKCDGGSPCSGCHAAGVACSYGLQKKRGPPKGFKHGGASSLALPKDDAAESPAAETSVSPSAPQQPVFDQAVPAAPVDFKNSAPPHASPTSSSVGSSVSTLSSMSNTFVDSRKAHGLHYPPLHSPQSRAQDVFPLGSTLAAHSPAPPPGHHPYSMAPLDHRQPTNTTFPGTSQQCSPASAHPPYPQHARQGESPQSTSALGLSNVGAADPSASAYPPFATTFGRPDSASDPNRPQSMFSSFSFWPQPPTVDNPVHQDIAPDDTSASDSSFVSQKPQTAPSEPTNGAAPPDSLPVAPNKAYGASPSLAIGGSRLERITEGRKIRLPSIAEGFGHYDLLTDSRVRPSSSSLGAYRGATSGVPNIARERAKRAIPSSPTGTSAHLPANRSSHGFPLDELEGLDIETVVPNIVVEEVIKIYYAWVHPLWPILYRPRPEQRTVEYASRLPLLFNAQCAWAAQLLEPRKFGMDCSNKALSALFRFRSQELFSASRCEASLASVQALHLMALVENANGYCSIAWQLSGIGCRMAQDLGLHRNHQLYRTHIDPEEMEDGLRAFMGIYCSDKIFAAWLGRPVSLREEDTDAEYAFKMDCDETDRWQDRLRHLRDNDIDYDGQLHCVTYFRGHCALQTLLETVLCRIYSVRRRHNYREEQDLGILDDLSNQLDQWHDQLPEVVRWRPGDSTKLPHVYVMHLWHAITIILLHRTFVPLRQSSWRKCTDAAECIFTIMSQYDETFGLQLIASTATYAVFTAATMFVANSASSSIEEAEKCRRKFRQCAIWLSKIGSCWRDATRYSSILKKLDDVGHRKDSIIPQSRLASRIPSANISPEDCHNNSSGSIEAPTFVANTPLAPGSDNMMLGSPSLGNPATDLLFWNELPISLDFDHWQTFTNSYTNNLVGGQGGFGPLPGSELPSFDSQTIGNDATV